MSIILAVLVLAPTAAADPLTLYHAGADPWIGTIYEDDGGIVNAPYNALHGLAQRATKYDGAGTGWGDGSLMLDSQWYASLGGAALTGATTLADEFRSCTQCVWPGHGQFLAWHGRWLDLNNDGRVTDVPDSQGAPTDEFIWEGLGSGANFRMMIWLIPYHTQFNGDVPSLLGGSTGDVSTPLVGTHDRASEAPDGFYTDLTSRSRAEQNWVTRTNNVFAGHTFTDTGVLATLWAITGANNTVQPGTTRGFDLLTSGLVDVDRYESISPDIESLYMSSTAPVFGDVKATRAFANEVVATVAPIRDDAFSQRDAAQGEVNRAALPPHAREPNNFGDEYPGATWSGQTDARGTGSDFTGYQESWHLWTDLRVGSFVPLPLHADGGPSGLTFGEHDGLNLYHEPLPSRSTDENGKRNLMPGLVTWSTLIALWHDANGDKWLQEVCDPESGAWDGAADECRDPYRGGISSDPNVLGAASTSETLAACDMTDAIQGTVTLMPLAPWTGVAIVRNVGGPTSNVWATEAAAEPAVGMEPLVLRNMPNCVFDHQMKTRDGLLLAGGSLSTPVIATTRTTLTQQVTDVNLGLDVPSGEYVVDVDFIPASL